MPDHSPCGVLWQDGGERLRPGQAFTWGPDGCRLLPVPDGGRTLGAVVKSPHFEPRHESQQTNIGGPLRQLEELTLSPSDSFPKPNVQWFPSVRYGLAQGVTAIAFEQSNKWRSSSRFAGGVWSGHSFWRPALMVPSRETSMSPLTRLGPPLSSFPTTVAVGDMMSPATGACPVWRCLRSHAEHPTRRPGPRLVHTLKAVGTRRQSIGSATRPLRTRGFSRSLRAESSLPVDCAGCRRGGRWRAPWLSQN